MHILTLMMRRFTISLRMLGAIAMVVSLLALVGGAGLFGMFRMQAQGEEFVGTAFTQSTHLTALYDNFDDVRREEQNLILHHFDTNDGIARYEKQWHEALRLLDAELASLRNGGVTPAQDAVIAKFQQSVAAYKAAFEPVVADIRGAKFENTAAVLKEAEKAGVHALAADGQLQALQKLLLRAAQEAEAGVKSSAQTTLVAFSAALAIALVLVVPLTLLNSRSIVRPIVEARTIAQAIAAGDLTHAVDTEGHDEAADLLRSLKAMQDSLRHLVGQLRDSAESIQTASEEVAAGNHDLSGRTEQAASSLQQTASSMTQLTGTVRQSADAASQANQLASSASNVASRGGEVVSQVVSTMDEINTSSKRIADIIGVIDGIAFQTNILALNAAVEAARAGEQGRGFAVVAGEVRSLAQRSAEAAREIKALIGTSVDKVETGARLVQDAGSTMTEIVSSVQRVTDIIGEITAAATEQSSGIGQVNQAVVQLDQMTQQNAALVEESTAAAESLKEQAHKLAGIVSTFRVDSAESAAHRHRPAAAVAPASAGPVAERKEPALTPPRSLPAPAAKPSTPAAAAPLVRAAAVPPAKPAATPAAAHHEAARKVIERARQPAAPAATPMSAPAVAAPARHDDGDWETF